MNSNIALSMTRIVFPLLTNNEPHTRRCSNHCFCSSSRPHQWHPKGQLMLSTGTSLCQTCTVQGAQSWGQEEQQLSQLGLIPCPDQQNSPGCARKNGLACTRLDFSLKSPCPFLPLSGRGAAASSSVAAGWTGAQRNRHTRISWCFCDVN